MVNLFIVIFFPEVTGLNVEIKGLIMPVQTSDTIACVRYDEWFELNGVTACQIFWLIVNVEVPDFCNISTSFVFIFWLWCHILGPINGAAPADGQCGLV